MEDVPTAWTAKFHGEQRPDPSRDPTARKDQRGGAGGFRGSSRERGEAGKQCQSWAVQHLRGVQGWAQLPFPSQVGFQGSLGAGKESVKRGGVPWAGLELWELWQHWKWIPVGKGSSKCQFLPSLLIFSPSTGFLQRGARQDPWEAIKTDADHEKGGAGTPSHPQEPQAGKRSSPGPVPAL